MQKSGWALAASVSLLSLAACGGGGGGNTAALTGSTSDTGSTQTGDTQSGNTGGTQTPASNPVITTAYPPPPVGTTSISAANAPSISNGGPGIPTAGSGTPTLGSTPPAPIGFQLFESVVGVSSAQVAPITENSNASAIFKGYQTVNGQQVPVFEFTFPLFGIDVPQVTGDGTFGSDSKGNQVSLATGFLNYSFAGVWALKNSSSQVVYVGAGVSGFQTPPSGIPTSGTATYIGDGTTGGVSGIVFAPSSDGTSVSVGTLQGTVSVNANFSTGVVSGLMTNMQAKSGVDGSTTPWNNVNLHGSISGARVTGTTDANGASPGMYGMSSRAAGTFGGLLFGPNGQELNASWNLYDTTAGQKSALGVLGAVKQ